MPGAYNKDGAKRHHNFRHSCPPQIVFLQEAKADLFEPEQMGD